MQYMGVLSQNVRRTLRSLGRAPVFTMGVIGTIALALGLNASVFTVFNAYVLRPLAVSSPATLHEVTVSGRSEEGEWTEGWLDWERYSDIRALHGPIVDAAASRHAFVRIGEAPAMGELVSGNYFRMLGVGAILGRTIGPDDADVPGEDAVIVLSHALWQSRFAGDPGILGKSIAIRGRAFNVVGVVGPEFTGLREVPEDFWAPVSMTDVLEGRASGRATLPRAGVLVRLTPGADRRTAAALLTSRLSDATAKLPPRRRINAARLLPRMTAIPLSPEVATILAPIAVAFVLILVIACANVGTMMLARGLARQRELGIRMALGATRRAVVAQLLIEAMVLVLPAAVLGLLVSRVALATSVQWMFATFPPAFSSYLRVVDLSPDARVFAFTLIAALASAVLFGLAPALQVTRHNVVVAARGQFDGGGRSGRLRDGLVMAQMATCLLLLVVAGVLLRCASAARTIDTGLRTAGVIEMELNDVTRAAALAELLRMSIVGTTGAARHSPAAGTFTSTIMRAAGVAAVHHVRFNRVSSGYFDLVGIRLIAGRTFTEQEERNELPVVVLSEAAARRVAAGANAIGMEVMLAASSDELAVLGLRPFRAARVVGVASNAIAGMIFTGIDSPVAYYPISPLTAGARVLASVSGSVGASMRDVERALERSVPGSVNEMFSVEDALETQVYPIRAASWISGLLGAIALLLTVSGIYGVLSYVVTQRTSEIGIRMALGASSRNVVTIIVRQALRLACVGGAIGLVLALGVSRVFASQFQVVSTFDAAAYLGSAAAALAAAGIAAWLPARRAARVEPLEALRNST